MRCFFVTNAMEQVIVRTQFGSKFARFGDRDDVVVVIVVYMTVSLSNFL